MRREEWHLNHSALTRKGYQAVSFFVLRDVEDNLPYEVVRCIAGGRAPPLWGLG